MLAAPPSADAKPQRPGRGAGATSDVRELPPGKTYSTKELGRGTFARKAQRRLQAQAAAGTPPVGTVRTLLALDDYKGFYYRKRYTLLAVGDKIEVWVANNTSFPRGDCRAQVPGTVRVTKKQAQYLADQFDSNIFPKMSAAFSVAPSRDGSGNQVPKVDPTGDGQKIMTLVDNVRDDNYYEGVNKAPTYIAGFFSSQINELLDRNVMTIDAYDWLNRTGANPPDQPTSDLCTSRPARPFLYESTFAHEYQHLLEYYQDPSETSWVNEGLSDFAQTLTGYVDANATVFDRGADSHLFCWQGYGIVATPYNPNPRDCGGPENSLTLWGDQPPASAILADYGEAYAFFLFLRDRYGTEFISRLHRDGGSQGLKSLQSALDAFAGGVDAFQVIRDFQVMSLVDKYVDPSGTVEGIDKARVTSPSLTSTVNLENPAAYARPGAPANGADFVALRNRNGGLSGQDLSRVTFRGARTLSPEPLKWTSVTDAPGRSGNPTLWSGNESNLDASAITAVTVPTSNPTLSFTERHLAEASYDYAYTVVSTDGGATYTALANANTVDGPLGPALNGDAPGFTTQTFDLSAYAGQNVLIGFRYVSDGGVNDGGWYVDDVSLGGTTISDGSDASVFKSTSQVRPLEVTGWNLTLVGLDAGGRRALVRSYPGSTVVVNRAALTQFRSYPQVVAIVSYDQIHEDYQPQALYTLKANNVLQPGGS